MNQQHQPRRSFLKTKLVAAAAATLIFLGLGAGSALAQRTDILGAGATFPAPLVTAMADEYRTKTGGRVTVNYQSIGSGGGIRQFIEQTVMFGMSEAFLSDQIMADIEQRTGGAAFNLPITLADVVPTYNLPGVKKGLVFDGDLLVDLFLGKIKRWNDPRIAELNPGLRLPPLPVTIVHRSDGSGTTNVWTSYLTRVSDEWAKKVGYATSVNWPTGVGGNGNEGVAGVVMNTPGALGYNSLSYAILSDISYGYVVNAAGNTIEPSYAATTAAADIDLPADTRVLFTNTPAPDGYPAAGFAWMLVYQNLDQNRAIANRAQAEELLKFLIWAIRDGQELSESLGFARLPQAAIDLNFEMIRQITWQDEKLGEKVLREMQR
ncbi:phosphate ABC transporter substrate-binding protein PstS [Desulfurivibrio dismutans]|uniref:phosphate ABC transporter substrate-binding protein PstS n=1 Tax=Desulfurivibrio dismutans TaxID=1398908 RepID=UPI0023D9B682|nr:phosphate ABC transporter substrate-binding protein PstS [Desulfurivibrio alkaliphilus]MDF1615492.1 phosphate ABC transporter substrate-binding protein PstS [Desulfurivibrio alkaliphilus]